jgi:2-isopropylmalate synthase
MTDLPNVGGAADAPNSVEIFDTTLRDGSQLEGISLTVDDKLRIAEQLDHLGVAWIEGGWPGANPKDIEFFRRAVAELDFESSKLVAFGSTRRVKGKVDSDPTLANLLEAGTDTVCIVGKAWDYHVTEALRTDLDEGVAMISDSVGFLVGEGRRTFLDAEHFFDGYKANAAFALRVLESAAEQGADCLVLCDTNGGSLPHEVERIVGEVTSYLGDDVQIGIHCHNDTGCAVANSLGAVRGGATHVQGTINGYGERVGNADLTTIIADLELKMDVRCLPADRLGRLTGVSHHVAELVNFAPNPQAPYVGTSAFAHKAGLHVSAIARRPDAYEHVSPERVGNGTRLLVSEMSGKSTLEMRSKELGLELDGREVSELVETLKRLEHEGYHFEAADASLELLLREAAGWRQPFFELESYRVINEQRHADGETLSSTEGTVKIWLDGERIIRTGEGNGPVAALDTAFRAALEDRFPALASMHLTDFKVRVLDTGDGTSAVTRVLIDTTDGDASWTTIGVSGNVIDASWEALEDAIVFGLLRAQASSTSEPAGDRN